MIARLIAPSRIRRARRCSAPVAAMVRLVRASNSKLETSTASSRKVHSTSTRAKPCSPFSWATVGTTLRAQQGKLGAELFGGMIRIDRIADHARADQHDELGAIQAVVVDAECRTEARDVLEQRNALAAVGAAVADQAADRDRLTVRHRHRRRHPALLDGRAVDARRAGRHARAYLLAQLHEHEPAAINARRHLEDDAGVVELRS